MTKNDQYTPPSGPPPSYRQRDDFAPPSGPPPSRQQFVPPPGPPPSRRQQDDYIPPPGPPPSKKQQEDFAPPSGPPPGYHDWTAIPDTALLPPPPSISYDHSPTANASEEEGEYAYNWCNANPLWPPQPVPQIQLQAIHAGQLTLIKPREHNGQIRPMTQRPGTWHITTAPGCRDHCLQTSLPIYSALNDSPLNTERTKTVYFEVHLLALGAPQAQNKWNKFRSQPAEEADTGVAVGFVAPPYPSWRLPGWQRGSLGVHGDDGRRYVNNTFGGADFTNAFRSGQTVGIGMTWRLPRDMQAGSDGQAPGYQPRLDCEVFFTRNGQKDGSWDLHEELDERAEGGVKGLEGECDVFAAVGGFGAAEYEINFNPQHWMYRPV